MRYLLLVFVYILSACTPRPHVATAPPDVPGHYSNQNLQGEIRPGQRWWRDFNDPSLDRLENRLFSGNLDLRQALHRLEQLEAQQRMTASTRSPQLNLNGDLNRSQSVGVTGESRTTSSSLSLAASYEVDLWNKLKNQNEAARLRTLAGADEVRTLLLTLSVQLAEQYFLAVEQRAQLNLLNRQIDRSQELLDMIAGRYRAGLATASAVYQAQRNLAVIEAQVPGIRTTLTQAENALALLLGQPPGSLTIARSRLPDIEVPIAIGLPADLLTRRPDVAAALHQLEAADRELAANLAERLPTLDLTASLGRSFNSLAVGDVNGTFWSLALGLTQPLFDGGRREAAVDQQEAIRNEQFAASRKTILNAIEEVETNLTAEYNGKETARRLERQLTINGEYLRTTRENYLAGLGDSTDWLNSEIDHIEIRSQQLSHQRQILNYRLALVRALGGRWMDEELGKQRRNLTNTTTTGSE